MSGRGDAFGAMPKIVVTFGVLGYIAAPNRNPGAQNPRGFRAESAVLRGAVTPSLAS